MIGVICLIEEWRTIPGYEGYYEVSNMGRVRSLDRIKRSGYGSTSKIKGKVLKPGRTLRGYTQVNLYKDGNSEMLLLHRIVAKVFIPNNDSKEKRTVNHIDGNKENNCINNLEWATYSENHIHAFKHGLRHWKDGMGLKSIPVVQLNRETGEFIAEYPSIASAGRTFDTDVTSSIRDCCNGKLHHTKGYKWMFKEDYEKSTV